MNKMTSTAGIRCSAIAALALSFGTSQTTNAQTRELGSSGDLLDGVAALVDEGVVLKSEVTERITVVVENFRAQQAQLPPEQRGSLPPISVLEQQVLDQLVLEQVQLQRAERVGIVIGDDILNEVLSEMAQGLGLTLQQLPAALANENIDYNLYREQQRQEMIISQLERRDVVSRIAVSPRELAQCLERLEETQTNEFDYNVSHILIGHSTNATPEQIAEARDEIESIQSEIEGGSDFAEMALTHSESQTALEGGALGWRKGAELPTIFADVVPLLSAGEVSEPVETSSGFHLVRLNDMRGTERVVVDQVRARHILVTPNEILDDDATMQRLIGIRNQIMDGDEFAAVASAVSEDVGSAANGGDLGWTEPGSYVDEFREKIDGLEEGVISAPFRTRFGWHIVEVLERRAYDMTDDLKEERCRQEIGNGKVEQERDLWTRRLRDEAFVELKL